MKILMKLLLVCTVLFYSSVYAVDKIVPIKRTKDVISCLECVFISKGPEHIEREVPAPADGWIGKYYRVGFQLSEIYYSISLEEINHNDLFRPREYINSTYRINGFELAGILNLKYKRITELKFVSWRDWNSFVLNVNKSEYIFNIKNANGNGEIRILVNQKDK